MAFEQARADRVELFVSGEGGYAAYRIPAIVVTKSGTLLAFCEGRKTTRADQDNHDALLRRSTDGGQTWSPSQLIHEEGGDAIITIGNPTAVVDRRTGTIWLALNRNAERQLLTRSDDDGMTWSTPRDITDQVKPAEWPWCVMGPGIGICVEHGPHAGRLILPGQFRMTRLREDPSFSHVIYSDDGGTTWQIGGTVGPHSNECQVVETHTPTPGLLLNMRSKWGTTGKRPDLAFQRIVARSTDGGETWSKPEFDGKLIEPHCQASILRYTWTASDEKSRILFANPADKQRQNLTVRLSYDEGYSWPVAKTIHAGPAGYSCLAALPDGRIGLLYEEDAIVHDVKDTKIVFTVFTLDWLTDGADRYVAR